MEAHEQRMFGLSPLGRSRYHPEKLMELWKRASAARAQACCARDASPSPLRAPPGYFGVQAETIKPLAVPAVGEDSEAARILVRWGMWYYFKIIA